MAAQPGAVRPRTYQELMEAQVADWKTAKTALVRILDEEADRRGLPEQVAPERLTYLLRAVLLDTAIAQKVLPKGQDPALISNARLWDLLKLPELFKATLERRGEVPMTVDWSFQAGGLWLQREAMLSAEKASARRSGVGLPWGPMRLKFLSAPESLEDFESRLSHMLEEELLRTRRRATWLQLVEERNPGYSWKAQLSMTGPELKRAYEERSDGFSYQPRTARVWDVVATGPRARDFLEALSFALRVRGDMLQEAKLSDEELTDQTLIEWVMQQRESEAPGVFQRVAARFSADVAAGRLSVKLREDRIPHDGRRPLPEGDSFEDRRTRAMFSPMFGSMALFPEVNGFNELGAGRLTVLREVTEGKIQAVPYADVSTIARILEALRENAPAAEQSDVRALLRKWQLEGRLKDAEQVYGRLKELVLSPRQAEAFRRTALDLLGREIRDPRRMVEKIFPGTDLSFIQDVVDVSPTFEKSKAGEQSKAKGGAAAAVRKELRIR